MDAHYCFGADGKLEVKPEFREQLLPLFVSETSTFAQWLTQEMLRGKTEQDEDAKKNENATNGIPSADALKAVHLNDTSPFGDVLQRACKNRDFAATFETWHKPVGIDEKMQLRLVQVNRKFFVNLMRKSMELAFTKAKSTTSQSKLTSQSDRLRHSQADSHSQVGSHHSQIGSAREEKYLTLMGAPFELLEQARERARRELFGRLLSSSNEHGSFLESSEAVEEGQGQGGARDEKHEGFFLSEEEQEEEDDSNRISVLNLNELRDSEIPTIAMAGESVSEAENGCPDATEERKKKKETKKKQKKHQKESSEQIWERRLWVLWFCFWSLFSSLFFCYGSAPLERTLESALRFGSSGKRFGYAGHTSTTEVFVEDKGQGRLGEKSEEETAGMEERQLKTVEKTGCSLQEIEVEEVQQREVGGEEATETDETKIQDSEGQKWFDASLFPCCCDRSAVVYYTAVVIFFFVATVFILLTLCEMLELCGYSPGKFCSFSQEENGNDFPPDVYRAPPTWICCSSWKIVLGCLLVVLCPWLLTVAYYFHLGGQRTKISEKLQRVDK